MSEYLRVVDGKMVAAYSGKRPGGEGIVEVPDNWPYFVPGIDVKNFDAEWRPRPLVDRVKEGLVVLTSEEVVDGEIVRAKTQLERYHDGLDRLPAGQKVVATEDGELVLETMSRAELVESGQLTAQAAHELDLADCDAARRAAYAEEADPLFFKAQRGEATEAEWRAKIAEIKARYPNPNPKPEP